MCLQTESSDGPSFHQGIGPHNDVLVPGCWFFNAVLCVYRLSQVMVRRSTKVLDHTMTSWCLAVGSLMLAVGSLMLYCVSTD